jgi:hypothetical protein
LLVRVLKEWSDLSPIGNGIAAFNELASFKSHYDYPRPIQSSPYFAPMTNALALDEMVVGSFQDGGIKP